MHSVKTQGQEWSRCRVESDYVGFLKSKTEFVLYSKCHEKPSED